MLGAILGQARAGEQTLLKRLVRRRPATCSPAASPASSQLSDGLALITAILDAGSHVIARVKEGISLDFADSENRGWLPNGIPHDLAVCSLREET